MEANERLVELLLKVDYALNTDGRKARDSAEFIAEYLLENRVILPPVTLDEKIIEAARLRYNNGRTIEEIAEIMDYNPRTIRRYLKRFEEACENGGMDL